MSKVEMKRKDAAFLISEIALIVGQAKVDGTFSLETALKKIEVELKKHGVKPSRKCNGEAHSNPHIDNCGACMPHWEWVNDEVKVR